LSNLFRLEGVRRPGWSLRLNIEIPCLVFDIQKSNFGKNKKPLTPDRERSDQPDRLTPSN